LVNLFKGIILSVLFLPWIIVACLWLNCCGAGENCAEELADYRAQITQLEYQQTQTEAELQKASREKQSLEQTLAQKEAAYKKDDDSGTNPASTGTYSSSPASDGAEIGGSSLSAARIEELAREVIVGRWNNGRARVILLQDAGYDHRTIQQRVNEIIWNK